MGISPDWIIRVILFGIVHWLLASFILYDISSRDKVFGNRKAPWVIVTLLIPCFGSILYLLFNPQVLNPDDRRHDNNRDQPE